MKESGKAIELTGGMQHRARKRYGQNFLKDQNVIDRIIQTIYPVDSDHLVEIGPGRGALTKPLALSGARLDCIELDRDLAAQLNNSYINSDTVTIHQQDVLKFDLRQLTKEPKSLRIVGNLPYNISTPVLFHLLKSHELIKDMTFMLQLEVVQRMTAKPDQKNYGRLGIMLQYFCELEHVFNVPAAAFSPKPKVCSAIVQLTPHRRLPVTARDVDCLQTVLRTAFSQRRKTLKNSLKAIVSEEVLNRLSLDTRLRPENLSLADYVLISDAITE